MAFEAALRLVEDQETIRHVELHNLEIVRAMGVQEDSPGQEVLFTLRVTSQTDSCITADVASYSGDINVKKLDGPVSSLAAHFSGSVKLLLGPSSDEAPPPWSKPLLPMNTLDTERFYEYLSKVGYNYSSPFRASVVDRHLNHAVVTVPVLSDPISTLPSMHPAVLDT